MKKLYTVLLAAAVTISLVACGSSDSKVSAGSSTDESVSVSEPQSEETSNSQPSETPSPSFEEQTIVDNEYCTFILKGINEDGMWGYSWNVYLENKTDETLMFGMENTSVNGFMSDPFWAQEVAPGKKSNETITWMSADFEKNGISPDAVTVVSFDLNVYDSEDWSADHLVDDTFTVYPQGEEMAVDTKRESQESDIVLFDTDQCSMTVTGFDPDSLWGYAINVYLVNKTDQNLMFSCSNASINGFMCDPFWADEVAAGKSANTTITWMSSSLEDAGIDAAAITEIELPIRVYSSEDYTANDCINETYTISPN